MLRYLMLPAVLLGSGTVVADGWSGNLQTGVTYTNNLEVQSSTGIAPAEQTSLNRSGAETGISLQRQSLDYTGGYVWEGVASLNQGLAGRKDITRVRGAAYRLSALTTNWLVRSGVEAEHYQNGDLPTGSYRGVGAETTLGYVGETGAGTDIGLSVKREDHWQVADTPYKVDKQTLKLVHYFPHQPRQAYWSVEGAYQQAQADDDSRDAASTLLGIQYNQWAIGTLTGQVGLQWRQDDYGQISPGENPSGSMTPPAGVGQPSRQDKTYLISASLGKQIRKGLHLRLSSNAGQYTSTLGVAGQMQEGTNARFHGVSATLDWAF
ncbi:MAG: hypothetical protein KJ914_17760 [Gammaproteobacteria bacterium]|nr:hypothetical protein [Gammaproteobacteria bacterium]MBU1724279.1 hypothetical protein [Gammaproteobacteria bacterium]MBU2006293.1 hypothetical protein [Gammaproteobacteria bacterium]